MTMITTLMRMTQRSQGGPFAGFHTGQEPVIGKVLPKPHCNASYLLGAAAERLLVNSFAIIHSSPKCNKSNEPMCLFWEIWVSWLKLMLCSPCASPHWQHLSKMIILPKDNHSISSRCFRQVLPDQVVQLHDAVQYFRRPITWSKCTVALFFCIRFYVQLHV